MARIKKFIGCKLNPNDLTDPKIVKSVSDNCDCIEFIDNFNSKSVNNVEIDSEHHTKQVIEECFESIIDTTESTSDVFIISEEGMYLTEQIQIPFSEDLSKICHLSKNLYNFANMLVRQIYFYKTREDYCIMPKAMVYLKDFLAEDKFLNYNSLYAIIKNTDHYKTLPAQTAQKTLKLLHQDWIDYWKAKKKWNLDPTRLFVKPKIPSFKKKYHGEHIVMFTNQQVRT